jgi:ABC-2 type transport system permease protein
MPVDSFVDRVTRIDSARLFANSGGSKNSSEVDENNLASNLVKFESHQLVGVEIVNPQVTRIAGGWAVMFLLFSLTGAATSLFDEKQEGTMKRLLCMPVTRSQILWSKYIYTLILGIVQMLVIFFFSWIFFKVDIFSNFGNLLIVIIAATSAAVAFGMLITSFAKSLNQASSYSTLMILVMSAIGGSWFPTSMLPDWMQILSKGTLTYWSVEAFLQVLWRQSSFIGILPNVLILLVLALAVNTYSLIRFNKGNIF